MAEPETPATNYSVGGVVDVEGAPGLCEENKGGCEHICDDTKGKVSCVCYRGYVLASDGITCTGESNFFTFFKLQDLIESNQNETVFVKCYRIDLKRSS